MTARGEAVSVAAEREVAEWPAHVDAMYDFYARNGIKPQRGQGWHDAGGSVIRWCFADAGVAESLATIFARE